MKKLLTALLIALTLLVGCSVLTGDSQDEGTLTEVWNTIIQYNPAFETQTCDLSRRFYGSDCIRFEAYYYGTYGGKTGYIYGYYTISDITGEVIEGGKYFIEEADIDAGYYSSIENWQDDTAWIEAVEDYLEDVQGITGYVIRKYSIASNRHTDDDSVYFLVNIHGKLVTLVVDPETGKILP